MEKHRKLHGYMLAALGAAMFSTKAIFIKQAYIEQSNASFFLALRMLMALPFFLVIGIIAYYRLKNAEKPMPQVSFYGKAVLTGLIGYYLGSTLDFAGLKYITAQLERLVLFTYPIFVMLLGRLFFGKPLTQAGIIAGAITYAGLMVVFLNDMKAGGTQVMLGTMLVLLSAVAYALYQILAKHLITIMGSILYTAIAMTSSSIASIISYMLVNQTTSFTASPSYLGYAAATAIVATVIPVFLINAGLARISPLAVAMVSMLSPVVTILLAVMILQEPFTGADAVGAILVMGGILYYATQDSKTAQPKPKENP